MAGIYIHIPFCRQACVYCNFHFSVSLNNKDELIRALIKEISSPADFIPDRTIETVYFGGGTPSLFSSAELSAIMVALKDHYHLMHGAEITLEANPDDINPLVLQEWQELGINRLSVGLQSFDETELKWMNRAHHAQQSLQCLAEIRSAGFTNFSADLIYGSPLQSNEMFERNFELLAKNEVPHLSCYALTVEPKTILAKQIIDKKIPATDPEKQAEQFALLTKLSADAGYEHYEISNFAKPGFRSRHNSSYWQGKPYYGFGPAAHSFNGFDKRRWNIANNGLYIQSLDKNIIPYEEETLTDEQRLNEYIMTSLRTTEGLDLFFVKDRFGEEKMRQVEKEAQKYIELNKLSKKNFFLQLNEEGKFFADGIAADLFV